MIELPLAHYRFSFRAEEAVRLPDFAGSTWRGAFGTALKNTLCATRLKQCDPCPLLATCAFPYLFEGRRPAEAKGLSTFERVSVPFALRPPVESRKQVVAGETVPLDLALFGNANERLLYMVHALAVAAERGVGPGRGRLSLEQAWRLHLPDGEAAETIFSEGRYIQPFMPATPVARFLGQSSLVVHLQTPLRLKSDGKLVTPEAFTAAHFMNAAVRRVSALAAFHTDAPLAADYGALKRNAAEVRLSDVSLRWVDWKRYSSRQAQRMAMGGLVGSFVLHFPEDTKPLLAWIDLAQWVGLGKGATMGLGQFTLSAAEERAG